MIGKYFSLFPMELVLPVTHLGKLCCRLFSGHSEGLQRPDDKS